MIHWTIMLVRPCQLWSRKTINIHKMTFKISGRFQAELNQCELRTAWYSTTHTSLSLKALYGRLHLVNVMCCKQLVCANECILYVQMITKQSIFESRRGADCDQNESIKVNEYSSQPRSDND